MSFDAIQTGSIIDYPYLWRRESEDGETEGRKSRRTVIGLRISSRTGSDELILLPITSKRPYADQLAFEIPDVEKRRAGLEIHLRLWIILDEYNYDLVGKSFYLTPDAPLGRMTGKFFVTVMEAFFKNIRMAKRVDRG